MEHWIILDGHMEHFCRNIQAPKKSNYDKRNRAIIDFAYATGARASEIANLNIDDINLSKNFAIVTGKGKKQRIVIFGDITAKSIDNYIKEVRPKLLKFPTSL